MAGVLYALASYIENTLTEMATEEVHMLLGVSGEIDNMGNKLRDLKNFLADADRRNITDQSVQAWVIDLRDAMYDATNILDLCELKAMEQRPMHDAACFNPFLFCIQDPLHAHNIGNRIKNLNKKLDGIKARSESFNFMNLGAYKDHGKNMASSSLRTRETSPGLDESSLVGENIEEDTESLVELLTKPDQTNRVYNKIKVFAIVGVSGIGKTTLARKIFQHDIVQKEFTKKIWLSVNQDFDDHDILRRVITEAGGDYHAAGYTMAALERTFTEVLKGHKTLLIMDDVWDTHAWENVIKTPLTNALLLNGIRVLITTRDNRAARSMMAEEPYHRIRKLEHEDAWLLLKKQVVANIYDEPQVEKLKKIGMDIIEKCDCLPLSVKVIGGLLHQKTTTKREWEKVLHNTIWSVSQMPEELNNAIYLSYQDLHPRLKPCFLYCSLLPRRARLFRDSIIGMWISEGFVHGSSSDLDETGRDYYNELIQRNLIEPDMTYFDQLVWSMHDIVRSFAQYVTRDEALLCHSSETSISDKLKSQKFIRLSVEIEGSKTQDFEWCSIESQKSLRTLISVGEINIKTGDSLLCFSSLRTLCLVSANFDKLAESLNKLKHLRYLSIHNSNTSMLPENIGKMKFLQHVSLQDCESLVKLPSRFGMLGHLRHLDIRGTGIKTLPKGFGGLTSLRNLYGFPAHMDGDWCSLEELRPLSKLMNLTIYHLENVAATSFAAQAWLGEKTHLRYLSLHCTSRLVGDGLLVNVEGVISEGVQRRIEEVFDELKPPTCLAHLNIKRYFGRRLPTRWMMPTEFRQYWSLRTVTMKDLACCTELPSGLSQLPCLELLVIIRAPVIKSVGLEFLQLNNQVGVVFPRLHTLILEGHVEWNSWEWETEVKAMPFLHKIRLNTCKLSEMPPGLAFHARALQELFIYDVRNLSSLENFTAVVHLQVFGNPDLVRISNLPKLQRLDITNCPRLKLLEGMPVLHRLSLEDHDMEEVPWYLYLVNPRHLQLYCSLLLLTCIAAGISAPEWEKLRHVQQVNTYADDEGGPHSCYVLYTRDPFGFQTNIIPSAICPTCRDITVSYMKKQTCPIGDGLSARGCTDKRLPLCQRFRCNAYRHLIPWINQACLHCHEVDRMACRSYQWTEAAVHSACRLMTLTREEEMSEA